MSTQTKEEQPISLKVMRLSKPVFATHNVNYYEPTPGIITKALDQITSKTLSFNDSQLLYPIANNNTPSSLLSNTPLNNDVNNHGEPDIPLSSTSSSLNNLVACEDESYPEPRMRDYTDTEILKLPSNFGMIYLGETFVTYICLNNETKQMINSVSLKIELQTSSQKVLLVESQPTQLDIHKNIEYISQYEIKELGVHILICTVYYLTNNMEQRSIKRFYKFQVHNPIAVKTKVNSLVDGRIFFEAQIQNTSQEKMFLEKVEFEAHDCYTSKDLNYVTHQESPYLDDKKNGKKIKENELENDNIKKSVFGSSQILLPNNVRQYLFMLEQVSLANEVNPQLNKLGKLDIQWRTSFGEIGHLQTSTLSRRIPPIDYLKIKVVAMKPEIIKLENPFECTVQLSNNSTNVMNIQFSWIKNITSSMIYRGKCLRTSRIGPKQSDTIKLQFIPLVSGLHNIGGFKIVEINSGLTKDIDHLTDVYVYDNEE